jgi:hypothetical protein
VSRLATPYVPRRPQETVLYGLVKEHWRDFVQHAHESYEAPLPKYVVEEFQKYLACGDFAEGFVHVQCTSCGEDLAVAFSCKVRGLCPSCAGRRMAGSAAHLVDRVLPTVAVRQYVLAFPYELSGLAATRPEVLAALSRIFWDSLLRRYRVWAKAAGYAPEAVETGAVTGVHRCGASLNVHVHFHLLCLDGVYVRDGDTLRFEPAPAPTRAELESVVQRVYVRVMKWLARRGLLRGDADASNAPPSLSPAEALATAGMQRGTLLTVRESSDGATHDDAALAPLPPPRVSDAVTHERFNLHASVCLDAHDHLGRERLCRYLSRPAFSLSRLRMRRDGNVSYRVKKASRGRVTERVMTPLETLARLAAIVPPPRYPLLRFHGVLAPRHRWRARVVPQPPSPAPRCKATARERGQEGEKGARAEVRAPAPSAHAGDGRAVLRLQAGDAVVTSSLTTTGRAEQVAPNVLSIAHWERILEGELYAASARIDWRTLLKRTFDTELRVCARCGGRLVVRAVVTEPASIAKLLAALRRPRAPPAAA